MVDFRLCSSAAGSTVASTQTLPGIRFLTKKHSGGSPFVGLSPGGPTRRHTVVPGAPRNMAAISSEAMLVTIGLPSIAYILSPSLSPFAAAGEPAETALILALAKRCSPEGGGDEENDEENDRNGTCCFCKEGTLNAIPSP